MTIPDSGALRARRHRQHKAGDHSLCRNCGEVADLTALLPPAEPGFDAARSLRTLAERLEAAHIVDPADAAVARELRMTLQAVAGSGNGRGSGDGDLAELFEAFGSA